MTEPIHSLEMEMATLGSAMIANDTADAIRQILPSPEMFYRPAHQRIWQACLSLLDDNLPTEMEFVAERLGESLMDLGNEDYLIQVAEYVPSPENGEYYAKEVLDHWVRRQYVALAQSVTAETSPDELHIRAEAIKSASTLGKSAPVVSVMGSLPARQTRGLSTGWKSIDEITSCGGFPIGQFCLVRAKTGVGKTPFLTQACINAAKRGRKPLYATFADLSHEELQERMMKFLTGWSHTPSDLYKAQDWNEAKKELLRLGIDVYDGTGMESGSNIETFCLWFAKNKDEKGYTEVYADYLQEIRTRTRLDRIERQEEVTRQFKLLTKKHQVAGILGAQISNNAQEGDMTKGGRDADDKAAIIFDIKPGEIDNQGEIRISKNRFGAKVNLPYQYAKEYLRFDIPSAT